MALLVCKDKINTGEKKKKLWHTIAEAVLEVGNSIATVC